MPKGRPRMTRTGHTYTPEATRTAEQHIRECAKYQNVGLDLPMTGPVCVALEFRSSKTKRGGKNRASDLDNYAKLCLDALNGIAFVDDVQVVELRASIVRDPGIEGETVIIIEEVSA